MKKAILIRDLNTKEGPFSVNRSQSLYKLEPPFKKAKYIVISAAHTMDHGPETYIFKSDEEGNILDWSEMEGSFIGDMDHKKALKNIEYTLTK